ncbi:MAG: cytochrome c oxidase accessory protein CcoG [Pirellulaceae bacterium]|nr:cytochrome c oxidase accessory protein CcoG [Pirellulaceae bacterium]
MSSQLETPPGMVNSTWREDGSRRWMYPRLSKGYWLTARRTVAYVLIAVFTLLPYLKIQGRPAVLLNIPAREFTILGFTFLPTDTLLLALLLVSLILGVFLVTALFGRVWCGWMCPQTVYMEFLYRPLERLFDGPPGLRHSPGKRRSSRRTVAKYAVYLLASAFLAHTFLAYFVGVDNLARWMQQSPLQHPAPFLVMLATTALMMFDFSYFREQTCIVACPYGRFQSVMLDRDSLIVSYDRRRGEPRGKGKHRERQGQTLGDCVDCGLCVDTCPTGIDIRNGLQLECIACTQCIDACDHVMDRIGKPRGLIRFSSQARIDGQPSQLLRLRVIVYPAIMVVLLTAFVAVLANQQDAHVTLLRGPGLPFNELAGGEISNQLRVKIRNRSGRDAQYTIALVGETPARLMMENNPMTIGDRETQIQSLLIAVPRSVFRQGRYDVTLRISDGQSFDQQFSHRLLGPQGRENADG